MKQIAAGSRFYFSMSCERVIVSRDRLENRTRRASGKVRHDIGMDAMRKGGKRYGRLYAWSSRAAMCVAILLAVAMPAASQQGEFAAPSAQIHGQGGSVLEVP